MCANPACHQDLIMKQTDSDGPKPIGEMAHIAGRKPSSARYDKTMTDTEINSYNNLILLCPTCHAMIDRQKNTYTTKKLHQMKRDHIDWVNGQVKIGVPDVAFAELEAIIGYIVSGQAVDDTSFDLITPTSKISKNNLSAQIEGLIKTGISRSKEVKDYIDKHPDVQFGSKLSSAFIAEYCRQKDGGLSGDALFMSLWEYAAGQAADNSRRMAGLVVLVYLFEACEVFEK